MTQQDMGEVSQIKASELKRGWKFLRKEVFINVSGNPEIREETLYFWGKNTPAVGSKTRYDFYEDLKDRSRGYYELAGDFPVRNNPRPTEENPTIYVTYTRIK